MITVHDILKKLEEWAPLNLAVKDDPVGLQAGERFKSVRKVVISLDITKAVIAEAVAGGADLIVTHHNIVRTYELRPTDETDAGGVLLALCRSGLASVAMHTNLDAAPGGINDVMASLIGLNDVSVYDQKEGIGRIGTLPDPTDTQTFAKHCKEVFRSGVVRYHDAQKPVSRVAICSGGGGSLFFDGIKAGCDTFVTGDVGHHYFLTAANQGVNLLDCGHFATENIIVPVIADFLQKAFPELTVILSGEESEPFRCL
ncbi:MAG: Nif3-like dinuclear metal center hexameric protein [Oscillospiraceae bacterium]|nr:Nif3-like dinuclear metal center hexameric protein [Oscillospiraceae bacterium]